jgi:ubiquinone/menaquinone biosynthesis C-methylase UbiE
MKFKTDIKQRLSGRHKACLNIWDYKGKKILDIGCGFGWFEKLKGKETREIIAIDLNKKDLKIAQKECKLKNISFIEGSALSLKNFEKEIFDVVVMFDVIEHIPKNTEKKALKEIRKILSKKGILVISTPLDNFSKFFDPAWYFGHRHYSEKKISKILKENGFKINKVEKKGGFWEIFSMVLFYPCKWIFNSEVPFKEFFDKKRD